MTRRFPALLALAAALLAGCADPSGLTTRATALDPDHLATGDTLAASHPAPWPDTEWWRRYGDRQLDALLAEALAASPDLRAAQARLDRARALAGIAEAARAPQLGLATDVQRQRFSANGLIPPPYAGSVQNSAHAELDLSWDLDLWGRNAALAAAALDQAQASEVETHAARLALTTDIVHSYVQLDGQHALADIARATLTQRRRILELTRERVQAGVDSQVELRQAEAAIPAAQEALAAIDEQIGLLHDQLAALAGAGPDRAAHLQRPQLAATRSLALPATLPSELLARRPDVVAARWRIEAASRDIDAARAEFYPSVNLAAFAGLQSLGLADWASAGSRTYGIAPALRLPILDGGRLRSNLSMKQADYDAAVEGYNAILLDALREVADAVGAARAVERREAAQREALARVEDAYRLALIRYREGLSNYLSVLSAEDQVLAQRRLGVSIAARRHDLEVALVRALGGGYVPDPASAAPEAARAVAASAART